jgi:hypothetical protein
LLRHAKLLEALRSLFFQRLAELLLLRGHTLLFQRQVAQSQLLLQRLLDVELALLLGLSLSELPFLGRLLALLQAQSTQAQHLPQPLLYLKLAPALLGLRRSERLLCAGLQLTLPKLCATELLLKLRRLRHAVRFELLEILRRR